MDGVVFLLLVLGVIVAVVGGVIYGVYVLLAAGSRGISREIARGKEEAKLEADQVRAAISLEEIEELRRRLDQAERSLAERDEE